MLKYPFLALAVASVAYADVTITQDFDGAGSPYAITAQGSFTPDYPVGPSGNSYLQLTRIGANDTNNRLEFGYAPLGSYHRIAASFDFRMAGYPDFTADGFGMHLMNIADHGTMAGGPAAEWEQQAQAGSFGIGFDDWNDQSSGVNFNGIRLFWAGEEKAFAEAGFNLAKMGWNEGDDQSVAFHHADLLVDFVAGGANVTLQLTEGGSSSPQTVFDEVFIAGMAPYEGRVLFGGRTGGYATGDHLDNISVAFTAIPEPASLALLGVAGLGLIRRRARA